MKKFKRILASLLMLGTVFSMSGCKYEQPENSQRWHHNYNSVLEYAKSIDPNATVAQEYTKGEEYYHSYREWDAVIFGVECHVASYELMIANKGFCAGLAPRRYYEADTDYGYYLWKSILENNQTIWTVEEKSPNTIYRVDYVILQTEVGMDCELSDEELTMVWEEARVLKEKYMTYHYADKHVIFHIPAPQGTIGFESGVHMGTVAFSEFTEENKEFIFEYYHQRWQEYGDQLTQ